MRFFIKQLLPMAIIGALLTNCKDGAPGPAGANGTNGSTGTQGPAGSLLRGNIVGLVNPLDEFGNSITKAGVTVTLEGVTPAVSAVTDAEGRYELPNVSAGTYNLTYSRADLSTDRRISVPHFGGSQPSVIGTWTMTQPSSTRITNVVASTPSGTLVGLFFNISNALAPVGNSNRYVVFVGSAPSVNSTTGIWYGSFITGTSSNSSNFVMNRSVLNAAGFASNSTAYAVVYGSGSSFLTSTDINTGRSIPVGLGTPSNVVSFIVP